jgi:hypothetical protein
VGLAAHLALSRNGHMDARNQATAEPIELSRGVMAGDRTRPRSEQSRPDLGGTRRFAAEGRVDPHGKLLPPTVSQPHADGVLAQAGLQGLPARYHAVLEVE